MHTSARHLRVPTTVGLLTLVADDAGLVAVLWEDDRRRVVEDLGPERPDDPVLVAAAAQLREYLAGTRRRFELPLAPRGNPFQQQVWALLRTIPYGQTRSYGDLARALGRPGAAQAVGAANAANPLSVVVPCHRVVGTDGTLTGFAGGLAVKRHLLALEESAPDDAGRLF